MIFQLMVKADEVVHISCHAVVFVDSDDVQLAASDVIHHPLEVFALLDGMSGNGVIPIVYDDFYFLPTKALFFFFFGHINLHLHPLAGLF